MKKIQLRSILLAILWIVCLLPLASPPARAENNNIDIWSNVYWNQFCDQLRNEEKGFFTGKTVNLRADIDTPNMAGIEGHDFTGTFDGHGHTITVHYGSETKPLTEQYAAPFRYVENGCVIRNLHVKGDIYTTKKYAAGIVGTQYGAVTIENCRSSVVIHSSVEGATAPTAVSLP